MRAGEVAKWGELARLFITWDHVNPVQWPWARDPPPVPYTLYGLYTNIPLLNGYYIQYVCMYVCMASGWYVYLTLGIGLVCSHSWLSYEVLNFQSQVSIHIVETPSSRAQKSWMEDKPNSRRQVSPETQKNRKTDAARQTIPLTDRQIDRQTLRHQHTQTDKHI